MHLLPAIDLRGGRVVRLLRGDYDRQTTYDADPVDQARLLEDAGSTWLHVVDLDGARAGEPVNLPIIEQICAATALEVEVGGGIRDDLCIRRLLEAGVTRAILGTAALQHWDWFEQTVAENFAGRLVLGLDARKGKCAIAGWEQELELTAIEVASRVTGWPLAAIVYTDIATDGTLAGPNLLETRRIAEATAVPVVASGGVGSLEHLRQLRDLPIAGVIVGRALYEGAFDIAEALAVFESEGLTDP